MPLICQNWPNWHPVNVSNVLLIGWPKLDKWHLAKIMGSQGFYVCRLHLDPCPHVAVVWQKKRGFLVAVLTNVHTHYAFSQKLATGMNNFFHFIIYLLNFSFCHYFDQGKRSCPRASCILYNSLRSYLCFLFRPSSKHKLLKPGVTFKSEYKCHSQSALATWWRPKWLILVT